MSKALATLKMGIKIAGVGIVGVEIQRNLSPMTVETLQGVVPKESRGRIFLGNPHLWMIMDVGVKVGIEKGKAELEKGDVAYFPQQDAILIAIEATKAPTAVNKIGRVTSGLEKCQQAPKGVGVTIAIKKS
ncbi:MAG: hypothetical protein RBG13Loki_2861 [Promethearchaeota archaeon CR_4]|nr:MAG: hypothetical protein RBG13Loki_2861 [Candidatus Lokiarchaeota archaeon CR_4]